jgi:probable rRNA maturation factor
MDYMEINVICDGEFENCPPEGWFQSIAEKALAAECIGNDTEMGLLITGQQRMCRLNKAYRNKDKPTDVLAFSFLTESGEGSFFSIPPNGLKHLGEVIVNHPQAVIQAQEEGHSIKWELALLVIHGVLHLLGYDHIEDEEAKEMESRQNELLDSLEKVLK